MRHQVSAGLGVDVAVVGGGPAGAIAALTLARQGVRVALIEASRYDAPRWGETLAPPVRRVLRGLGLWDRFLALQPIPSYGNRSAWGSRAPQTSAFIFSPHGSGWHVDRNRFDAMLAGAAAGAGARVVEGGRVVRCAWQGENGWHISVESAADHRGSARELSVFARGLIDATGRKSSLLRWLGGRRAVHDHLIGVAVRMRSAAAAAGGYTLIEAVENGWWYSAPLPGHRLMVMLMTDADLLNGADRRLPGWLEGLRRTEHTAARCRGFEPEWGPCVQAAVTHRMRQAAEGGPWLAAGDAALGVDPLSSSGIERALRSGAEAGTALLHAVGGDGAPAQAYEQALDAEFDAFRARQQAYYALENRWPAAPFWRRRHAPPAASRQRELERAGTCP